MWRNQSDPLFPWAKTIDRIVASERPQAIDGPAIIVATDSGGTDHRSRYRVNVYLCVDVAASAAWERARTAIRRTHLSDGRRMAYKSLSDRNRLAAVVPFLDAAVHMHGLCLVVIVNKDLRHLCSRTAASTNVYGQRQIYGRGEGPRAGRGSQNNVHVGAAARWLVSAGAKCNVALRRGQSILERGTCG